MDISTAIIIFLVIFSIQWYYTINRCENQTLSTTRNETTFDRFDECIQVYSSKGLPFLIERTSKLLILGFDQTLSTTRNETTFDRFDECIQVYSSKGLPFLIERTSQLLILGFDQISQFLILGFDQTSQLVILGFDQTSQLLILGFDHRSSIMVFILFALLVYGMLNRQSDVFQTASDVFHALKDDLSKATLELWSSIQLALFTLYQDITVIKIIEMFVIGLFLSSAPDLLDFLSKAFGKGVKV